MSDDSKSFEKKLDRDFLYYLNLTKGLFNHLQKESDQQLCEVWLKYLLGKTICSLAEKCDRNIFLSRLLLQMQSGQLTGVFLETPPSGTLPCSFITFSLPVEVDGLKGFEEMGFQVDSSIGVGSGDLFEASRDGRTYLATRHLPQGIMAYVAVTNNEGEPAWIPQARATPRSSTPENKANTFKKKEERYTKKLLDYIEVPLRDLRKSPEEREQVFEWMDKIINDCNKWIQGEDPHNVELEQLFDLLYEDYKKDPEHSELLNHPKTVRNILFRDIRDKILERRAETSKRELILDQYESEQYSEVRQSDDYLDEVWLECAKKPMSDSVRKSLEAVYPQEVVQRFTELLFQERLLIIQRDEKQAKKRIAELRKTSIEDTKKELKKLKKVQNDYKELYGIYKEIEEKMTEFEKEYKLKCKKPDKFDEENFEKFKKEIEFEIQQAKRNFDKEVKTQYELREKLEEAKENYQLVKDRVAAKTEKLNCESEQIFIQKEDLKKQICLLRKQRNDLKCKLSNKTKQCHM